MTSASEQPPAQARFGLLLRYWRERAGWTQVQLAARLKYDHSFVSRLEAGQRPVSPRLAARVDELLGAGGELANLAFEAFTQRRLDVSEESVAGTGVVPLPGECRLDEGGWEPVPDGWLGRALPPFGVICPLHGTGDCEGTTEPTSCLADLDDGGEADAGQRTVHGLVGLLCVYTMAGLESSMAGIIASVEGRTHAVARRAYELRGRGQVVLLHLAASYADLAGQLRSEVGQQGLAMAWLQRGVQWGTAAGNVPTVGRILGQMSQVARLENDAGAATAYARALAGLDRSRKWTSVHAQLHLARASALEGDRRGFERQMAAAQHLASGFDDRDRAEAPWLCDMEGTAYFHAFLAGGLRDVVASRPDVATARRAAMCAEVALDAIPAHMRKSRMMLLLRLADARARAGQVDAAIAAAAPVLVNATSSGLALIEYELRHLRNSLPGLANAGGGTDPVGLPGCDSFTDLVAPQRIDG